jgi:hypothetical protein
VVHSGPNDRPSYPISTASPNFPVGPGTMSISFVNPGIGFAPAESSLPGGHDLVMLGS